jgi:hypothetical protein
VKLGEHGKLYMKEVLQAFYPELSDSIISKIQDGTYFIRQFGLNVNNTENGGSNSDSVTWSGNTDKSCLSISEDNSLTETYKIWDHEGTFNVGCTNQFLDDVDRYNSTYKDNDKTHIQIVKAAKDYSNVDKCKPVVMVSQNEPLIIANAANGKLVTKDSVVTNVTHYNYKQFADENGRILDCTDKGAECKSCQDSVWDFQGEVPVYTDGCML